VVRQRTHGATTSAAATSSSARRQTSAATSTAFLASGSAPRDTWMSAGTALTAIRVVDRVRAHTMEASCARFIRISYHRSTGSRRGHRESAGPLCRAGRWPSATSPMAASTSVTCRTQRKSAVVEHAQPEALLMCRGRDARLVISGIHLEQQIELLAEHVLGRRRVTRKLD
jgi:hypothetical protein